MVHNPFPDILCLTLRSHLPGIAVASGLASHTTPGAEDRRRESWNYKYEFGITANAVEKAAEAERRGQYEEAEGQRRMQRGRAMQLQPLEQPVSPSLQANIHRIPSIRTAPARLPDPLSPLHSRLPLSPVARFRASSLARRCPKYGRGATNRDCSSQPAAGEGRQSNELPVPSLDHDAIALKRMPATPAAAPLHPQHTVRASGAHKGEQETINNPPKQCPAEPIDAPLFPAASARTPRPRGGSPFSRVQDAGKG
jgi:hypothetical protein